MNKKTSITELKEFVSGYKMSGSGEYLVKNKELIKQVQETKKGLRELSVEERAAIEDDLMEIFRALVVFEEKLLAGMEEINADIQKVRSRAGACKAYSKTSGLIKPKKD